MTMNFGNPMMGMNMMSGMNGNSGNINTYYKNKYSCDNCMNTKPYWQEYPKPVLQVPKNSLKPSLWKRFINNVLGG